MEDWLLPTLHDFLDVVVLCTFTNHQQLQKLGLAEVQYDKAGGTACPSQYSTNHRPRPLAST
jgi:hypothetical protein